MRDERITVFAGHYGSGKTNIAVNYAIKLKSVNNIKRVAIADLDIVNPYFRTKDSINLLTEMGIRVITSEFANTNLDAPAMPATAASIFDDTAQYGIIDLGGDDRGAVAIGRYKKYIEAEQNKNILLVINCYRPLSGKADDIIKIKNEIEYAAGFKFNGIVNNSNLGEETEVPDVIKSVLIAAEVSKKCSLPVVMTCADERLLQELKGNVPDLFGLTLRKPEMLMYVD